MPERAPLVMLPGMMCDERLFAAQVAALSRTHEVRTARFADGHSIEDFAVEALSLFEARAGRVDLVGLSMGGIVAMACLSIAPERIGRVALLDTNPVAEAPERSRLRISQIERALAGELDTLLIDEMKPLYLAPANRHDDVLLELVLDMARKLGSEVFARQSRALAARADYRDVLSRWPGEVLVLCGAEDTLCPPATHELMHGLLPRSTLVSIEGAGHLPTLEQPKATLAALQALLDAQSS